MEDLINKWLDEYAFGDDLVLRKVRVLTTRVAEHCAELARETNTMTGIFIAAEIVHWTYKE